MNHITSALKDRLLLLGWIIGLTLAAVLLWSLTSQFRSACLMRSANRVLAAQDDPRSLSAPMQHPFASPVPMGCWYTIEDSPSLFFVFAILRDGILVPCGAEISEKGEVTDLIPLGSHARKVIGRIPQGQVQVYLRRIESAAAKRAGEA